MSEQCNSESCSGCNVDSCSERKPDSMLEKPHELSKVKKVIGVVSGKGGVGKTLVTSLLAVSMRRLGYKTAILDADVTGPSIPKAFGIKEKAQGNELGVFPAKSVTGIEIMSTNLLLENETDPVIWRGPVIAGTVKQFWTDVIWSDVDYMFVDMPPGTGDVPLTVFQSIPVDGIVIVTSPQELVSMIVEKAVNMAKMMNVPVLGLVENLSYFECPDCGKKFSVFGESHVDEVAKKHQIETVSKMPINPSLAAATDNGSVEYFDDNSLNNIITMLKGMEDK
ncbi:Mrp family chromosome partitioning ATPase [Aequitasia blattaphilus]|uniref:Iron-sulfur cluster carrier protein n=1 Tax=Aequitasia blattaphilus TaxID=2949332 RepID=A0ABT1E8K8_9FIRM|nr:Mrp/NBP35 family ATP-binding protein [Aequitasia blattaphilus]MCP1102151.1 Mrp/NBP35 family ATP-binding protein [Aequitasia blattaphilus]MCR8614791.1 Mrp/NBP35 family ATP-binding protein [Aequitasia blattaphilus]